MSQNIFDNSDFFEKYIRLRSNEIGHNALIEQPAIRSLLADVKDKTVLDCGCGTGEMCRYLCEMGARRVVGVDISTNMINYAKERHSDTHIEFIKSDVLSFDSKGCMFDIVLSSLTIQYIEDYAVFLKVIRHLLLPGGQLVFSVEHPVYTSSSSWTLSEDGKKEAWNLSSYADEGKRVTDWLVPNVVKYHRKLETYLAGLIGSGFSIKSVIEPQPDDSVLLKNQSLAYERIRPPYLVISACAENESTS